MTDLSTAEQRRRAERSMRAASIMGAEQAIVVARDGSKTTVQVVGDDERVDPPWVDGPSKGDKTAEDLFREKWAEDRRSITEHIRATRENAPLPDRVASALARMLSLSNLRARPISSAPDSSNDERPGGKRPPGQDDPEIRAALRRVQNAVTDLEHALDMEEGIAPARNLALLAAHEKDRELLFRHPGVPAAKVARDYPELGSRATVYRKRKEAGLDALGLDPDTKLPPDLATVNQAVRAMHDPKRYLNEAA